MASTPLGSSVRRGLFRRALLNDAPMLDVASRGHDNNLNLLRVLAALLVLLSHSFTIATGNSSLEPGRRLLGMSLGDMAVDIFFVISGFLVSKSIFRSGSLRKYAAGRALRILPGLWVSLLLTVAVVSAFFSEYPLSRNLADQDTWRYLGQNGLPLWPPEFMLPGAFSTNLYPYNVNASLWTLPLEVWMYILLALAWGLGALAARKLPARSASAFVLLLAALLTAGALGQEFLAHSSTSLRHASTFFIAALMQRVSARIRLSGWLAMAAVALLALVAASLPACFEWPYRLLLPYVVMYVAFVPRGVIRRYNALGDYSYGIYIYAFPIQQMVASLLPEAGTLEVFLLATAATFACAAFSWHCVESPALALRARIEGSKQLAGT